MSRTLSGLFLVGALNRPRKRKRTNRENPWTIPKQIGKIREKSGKSQKGQKRKDKSRSGSPGDSFCDPNPHIQGKNMNKNMAPKLPNLPCFEAFGVIFCTDVCSYFCLVCGGRGSLAQIGNPPRLKPPRLAALELVSGSFNSFLLLDLRSSHSFEVTRHAWHELLAGYATKRGSESVKCRFSKCRFSAEL